MNITNLDPNDQDAIRQTATLLIAGFQGRSPAWPDMDSALQEVQESLAPGRISRVARNAQGTILGWIGAIPQYDGHVWELHPLVVHPQHQGRGIGRGLVADLEARVAARGGLTLFLGTDDETNSTTLGGVDLYPDVLQHLAAIRNLRRHPFEFYLKVGFSLVGVVPDANGPGKPDILMAKRVDAHRPSPRKTGEEPTV